MKAIIPDFSFRKIRRLAIGGPLLFILFACGSGNSGRSEADYYPYVLFHSASPHPGNCIPGKEAIGTAAGNDPVPRVDECSITSC